MNEPGTLGHSPHRIAALTDGIYAVAMTLLVIELKFPEHAQIHTVAALADAMGALIPRFISWLLSFLVLALFWFSHHRTFDHLRHVNGPLIAINILQLAVVSLMPFASALIGEYGGAFLSQAVYSGLMILLAIFSLALSRYVFRHPELSSPHMTRRLFRGSQLRNYALIVISVAAITIGYFTVPALGNLAYLAMAVVMPMSRRYERRGS
jgi:uncharacterized membrane protein